MQEAMLRLENVEKDYAVAGGVVHALRGVSINFRKSEFVAILGPSGCGKTTLLNVIGGLDHYSGGDMCIGGVSTKQYKEKDWNTYRNHTIGFVFQSYNLIPHQTVLANVELALTLSGVSKEERLRRAKEALQKVGLGDQLHKLPAQMSGGQMQRVAIARALVNDPEILLADEPTGALDSVTSVQIMDILKEISKDKLIIMVTHNPELADEYANRIIRLKDGVVTDDSNPFDPSEQTLPSQKQTELQKKKTSMSFLTALSLSFHNLMTKKARTLMISIAGSIGIIGIALILSVSSGVQAYIDSIEQSTMSSYPLTIQKTSLDMAGMLGALMGKAEQGTGEGEPDRIYSQNITADLLNSFSSGIAQNDLKRLKKFLESGQSDILSKVHDIQYQYATDLNFYLAKTDENGKTYYQRSLQDYYELFEQIGFGSFSSSDSQLGLSMSSGTTSAFQQLVGDDSFIKSQYDLVYGAYPKGENEVVLLVDENGRISDFVLYMAGVLDPTALKEYNQAMAAHRLDPENNPEPAELPVTSYSYEELCAMRFMLVHNAAYYSLKEDGTAEQVYNKDKLTLDANFMPKGREIKVVGILKPSSEAVLSSTAGGIGYTAELMTALLKDVAEDPVVKAQMASPEIDILHGGVPFVAKTYTEADYDEIISYALAHKQEFLPLLQEMQPGMTLEQAEMLLPTLDKAMVVALANQYMVSSSTYEKNLSTLGMTSEDSPSAILIYPKDFESKDEIVSILDSYSNTQSKLTYTDTIALMLESVTTIVNAISYVLVAFVAISLVVSSIMIGVITYISVLERTKEIGILRAMGASRGDIGRVFNAETLVIGLAAGVLGIAVSLGLIVIINIILHALTGIPTLSAVLMPQYALILVGVSMILTLVAGLIPSGFASRRDPVEALRSE